MPKKPIDQMLPAVRGVQIDLDDRDKPTHPLVLAKSNLPIWGYSF